MKQKNNQCTPETCTRSMNEGSAFIHVFKVSGYVMLTALILLCGVKAYTIKYGETYIKLTQPIKTK